jgi:hypothetical protein
VNAVPTPSAHAVPINEPATVRLQGGERATVEFSTVQAVSELRIPIVAISKHKETTYTIKSDGRDVYGPADIPPTDIDDLGVCFVPALPFEDTLTVEVVNLSSSARDYHIQPIGWEPQGGGA